MRVSRKGQVVSSLEADWLELTAAYYRKGWSLVDSFVYWDTPKGWSDVSNLHSYSQSKNTLLQVKVLNSKCNFSKSTDLLQEKCTSSIQGESTSSPLL